MTKARDTQVAGTHYKNMGVEPWDVVDTWPIDQRIGYYRGGALKYIMRMGSKDESAQEVAKGKHYMEKLLETLEEQHAEIQQAGTEDQGRVQQAPRRTSQTRGAKPRKTARHR